MPTINFTIKNKKNRGLIINGREFLALYFYGVDIVNNQGTVMNVSTFETYIRSAQNEFEDSLGIKFIKQVIDERSDYSRDEFRRTGIINTRFMVNKGISIGGYFGDFKQLSYPSEWLTSNTVNGVGKNRQILVVPNANVSVDVIGNAIFAGNTIPYYGLTNNMQIGSYWRVQYITGFGCENMPYGLLDVIGKWAAIKLFNIMGDLILGSGIASQSISLDGLSQSIASTASATSSGFGARILQYIKEIDETLKRLKGIYKGISLASI